MLPPPIYPFLLLLSQTLLSTHAAPAAAIDPASLLSLPAAPASANPFPSLFDEADLTPLAHLLLLLNHNSSSSSTDTPDLVRYRVPGTHITLGIGLEPEHPIPKLNLGRTILRTQQTLSAFINAHDMGDEPLSSADDPYESDPRSGNGCHFGVATLPDGYPHLTYGVVMDVLQGLWLYLYRGERFAMALFEVVDDQYGSIGVGKVSPWRPVAVGAGA